MADAYKATKRWFILGIIFLPFCILGYFSIPTNWTHFIPYIISLFGFLLSISFAIPALEAGEKRSWNFIIISGVITLFLIGYILSFILPKI